jgi:uncharacterized membrane protein YebE (DUF533 family)
MSQIPLPESFHVVGSEVDHKPVSNKTGIIKARMLELLAEGKSIRSAAYIVGAEVGLSGRTIVNKWEHYKSEQAAAANTTEPVRDRTTFQSDSETQRHFKVIVKALAADFDAAVEMIGKDRIQDIFSKVDL